MKRLILFVVFLSFNLTANSILIKSGQFHDGQGNSSIGDILITDNKIVEVGKFLNSSSAKVIEARGKPVTPGLISPISNLGVVEINALDVTNDDITELDEVSFIKDLIDHHKLVTIFLISGIKLEGTITSSDSNTLTLKGTNNIQLVYKHAISTILPV